eukprot:4903365-Amphidinium_carterae.1
MSRRPDCNASCKSASGVVRQLAEGCVEVDGSTHDPTRTHRSRRQQIALREPAECNQDVQRLYEGFLHYSN